MTFNSLEFFVFLSIVWLTYWSLSKNTRVQTLFLLVASYVFYGWIDWSALIMIALTSLFTYLMALLDVRCATKRSSKIVMITSVVVNLSVLAVFWMSPHIPALKLILPVGMSFYIFQAISYSIDVYRREVVPTKDPISFFLFLSFFPKVLMGPIERAKNLLVQIEGDRTFSYPLAILGARQFLWGLVKKVVVADNCAVIVQFALAEDMTNGLGILLGVFFYTIQIYADFSGYSDMALGVSRFFGFELKPNFHYPYFSRNIAEFWRRWHMSLMTWFRDYLYIPLGGNRCSTSKRVRNTFIIFLLSGFWHGASWTFILWGAIHAAFFLPLLYLGAKKEKDIVANDAILPSRSELKAMILTFVMVMFGWLFFRAPDITTAFCWLGNILNPMTWILKFPSKLPREFGLAIGTLVIMFVIEWINRRCEFGLARLPKNRYLRWLCYVVIAEFVLFGAPQSQSFLYFNF